MILAFSLGDSVVNHFASLCCPFSTGQGRLWIHRDLRLCPAARAESSSCKKLAMVTSGHRWSAGWTYLMAIFAGATVGPLEALELWSGGFGLARQGLVWQRVWAPLSFSSWFPLHLNILLFATIIWNRYHHDMYIFSPSTSYHQLLRKLNSDPGFISEIQVPSLWPIHYEPWIWLVPAAGYSRWTISRPSNIN
jgi:hypothetical protein